MDFESMFQDWLASLLEFLPKLMAGIVIFIIALVAAGFIAKAVKRALAKRIESEGALNLSGQITHWAVIIMGLIFALDQVDFNVTGFIAGLGVAGFTIGFALQDIAKNLISGLILLYRQPFKIGDTVEVADFIGTVRMINIRDTEILTLDGELVIIPNSNVFENPIINASALPLRRNSVGIGLGYDEDVDGAMTIFLAAIQDVPGVEAEPEPMIRVVDFGDSALSLKAFYWVNQENNNVYKVHTDVLKAINRAAVEQHINLPYPTQTLLIQQTGGADQG